MGNTRLTEEDLKKMGLKVQPDGSYKKPVFDAKKHHPDPVGPKGEVGPKGYRNGFDVQYPLTIEEAFYTPVTFSGTVFIDPLPAARPRVTKTGHAYNTPKYTAYKKALIILIKELNIPKEDWGKIECTFFYKFTKGIPQYKRYEGMPRRVRPDADNLGKAVLDALEQAGGIKDDGQMYSELFVKKYTFNEPRIEFTLYT